MAWRWWRFKGWQGTPGSMGSPRVSRTKTQTRGQCRPSYQAQMLKQRRWPQSMVKNDVARSWCSVFPVCHVSYCAWSSFCFWLFLCKTIILLSWEHFEQHVWALPFIFSWKALAEEEATVRNTKTQWTCFDKLCELSNLSLVMMSMIVSPVPQRTRWWMMNDEFDDAYRWQWQF